MAKKKVELPPEPLKSGQNVYLFDAPDQVWIITSINHEGGSRRHRSQGHRAGVVFKYPISKLKRVDSL